jgi:hypothetical protein
MRFASAAAAVIAGGLGGGAFAFVVAIVCGQVADPELGTGLILCAGMLAGGVGVGGLVGYDLWRRRGKGDDPPQH